MSFVIILQTIPGRINSVPYFTPGYISLLIAGNMDGYGPETITIYDTDGEYDYFVHDFNRTGTIGGCKATVKIYLPGQAPVEYVVPEGSGNCWNVCHISNGQETPVNTIDNPQYSSFSK